MAGLMAAYGAAKEGATVKVVSEGLGCLSISPGCIDLLGYNKFGELLHDPWQGISELPAEHPYQLIGADKLRESLDELTTCLAAKGYQLKTAVDKDGKPCNTRMPTIMGTLKPGWLVPAETGIDKLADANKILIISVKGFRDCKPALVAAQLRRYPGWEDKNYDTFVLPAPFTDERRSISALDLAHFADRPEGRDWFLNRIQGLGKNHDLVLLPPILGALPNSRIRAAINDSIGCPVMEMQCIPPGVAGLRIRKALVDTLVELNVEFYENAQVTSAVVENKNCQSINLHSSGRELTQSAKAYVIATGGIIGGGLLLAQGKATEAVFGLDVPVPANVDEWTEAEIFGRHLISRIGVKADSALSVPDLENVHFAGRILGGYDWASEKSGHGVACGTGWVAGQLAAAKALGGNK